MKVKGLGIISAITASVCCLGPFVLILAGLGSLGLGAVIGKYHWYFILAAGILLAVAWRSYFKEKKSCEAKLCVMEGKKMTMTGAVLTLATAVVLTFAGLNLYTYAKGGSVQEISGQGIRLSIPVEGMSCFTCETAVQSAVKKLPGVYQVKASARDKVAIVSYDPLKTNSDQIAAAINQTGYKAEKPKI